MASRISIRSDFPNALDSKLLRKVCRYRRCSDVYVSQFRRFGLSGAHLLLIYFARKPAGVPFLLKVAGFKKAKSEYNATRKLGTFVQEARSAADRLFSARDRSGRKWGALLYDHRGADSPEGAVSPRALREVIYNKKTSANSLRSILKEVFRKLESAHSKCCAKTVLLQTYFRRYFRKHGARARIRRVLEPRAESEKIPFLGARIYNPLVYLDALPKRVKLLVGSVHGDLHPDNIIIDRNEIPHLIDFAWAHKNRDVLVDFVLLENSIRFMAFPRPINLKDQLKVDRALVHRYGFRRINSLTLCSPKHRKDYTRLAGVVRVIRERAHAVLGDQFSMERYLLAQFIVLYGLLRYEDYEPYVSTRALGLIAARLKETESAS